MLIGTLLTFYEYKDIQALIQVVSKFSKLPNYNNIYMYFFYYIYM